MVVLAVISVSILKAPLRRFVDRALAQHADDSFSFAAHTIFETWWIARKIDKTYAAIGLQARTDALEHSRRALLTHAGLGPDSALAEAISVRSKADHDLRSLEDLARLFTSALTVLQQAKSELHQVEELQAAIAQIDHRLQSSDLADALKTARWPDAHGLLEKISFDLGRVLDLGKQTAAMPEFGPGCVPCLERGRRNTARAHQGGRERLPASVASGFGAR